MGRVIKFRAWDGEIMIVGDTVVVYLGVGWIEQESLAMNAIHIKSDTKSLMQFTGFQDINGNDIYEGDVLHQLDPVIWNPFEVEYSDQSASYIAGGLISKMVIKEQELVIIGNIHENPELLKGE